eukprot:scaffold7352_cov254-Pinguiococcus_pyrenoidosus.AAC.27
MKCAPSARRLGRPPRWCCAVGESAAAARCAAGLATPTPALAHRHLSCGRPRRFPSLPSRREQPRRHLPP